MLRSGLLVTVGVGCAAALLTAGCSSSTGGNGSSASAGAGTSSSSASPSVSPSASPLSAAALSAIVVQAADLPATWKATAYKADPTDEANQQKLYACLGIGNPDANKVNESHSEDFALDDSEVSSDAASYKSSDDVAKQVAVLTNPKINSCYLTLARSEFATTLPAGSKVDKLDIAITPGSAGGPSNVVATGAAQITITLQAQTVSVYVDLAFITGKTSTAQIDFENVGTRFPADLKTQLIAAVAKRASTA